MPSMFQPALRRPRRILKNSEASQKGEKEERVRQGGQDFQAASSGPGQSVEASRLHGFQPRYKPPDTARKNHPLFRVRAIRGQPRKRYRQLAGRALRKSLSYQRGTGRDQGQRGIRQNLAPCSRPRQPDAPSLGGPRRQRKRRHLYRRRLARSQKWFSDGAFSEQGKASPGSACLSFHGRKGPFLRARSAWTPPGTTPPGFATARFTSRVSAAFSALSIRITAA